ncbi:MAG: hypothetical protein ACYTE8_01965 [Planctomycetota bacterium]
MKTNTQIRIGLITSLFCFSGVLYVFTLNLIQHLSDHPPHGPYIFVLIGLPCPILYGLALISKQLKLVQTIFFVWLVGWIALTILSFFRYPPGFLMVLFVSPICAFLPPLYTPFRIHSSFATLLVPAFLGLIVMALLWIGLRGLKKLNEEQLSQINEESDV